MNGSGSSCYNVKALELAVRFDPPNPGIKVPISCKLPVFTQKQVFCVFLGSPQAKFALNMPAKADIIAQWPDAQNLDAYAAP